MTSNQALKKTFQLHDFPLDSGEKLASGWLSYLQIGELNAAGDNLILLPTYYGGTHEGILPWIGADSPLNPAQYCLVIPNLIGNGVSVSPSNAEHFQAGPHFPAISLYDNVRAQKRLLESCFDDAAPALVMGWSMGGMQALHWGALYPDRVQRLLSICATARCWPHNQIFLAGVKAALTCDAAWQDGGYQSPPDKGLKAFGRVYAGWAYSQAFFRKQLHRELGLETLQDVLDYWEEDHLQQDANNLLCVLESWQQADISQLPAFAGDPEQALASIRAPSIIMPSSTDLYFTAEDAAWEAARMPHAELRVLESDWGHIAGAPGRSPVDHQQIMTACADLLTRRGLAS
ncbi:alpha/beta fold hydrolase [Halopseudomonas salegens]|uniref:Homoserine O-acetyltransferase n=1 Tax=Halopseudomonas salegens TaxID=1434072 RepID=A0A1H2H4U5_9GAMM|nr:alpha/beta fold hydrolase [Halopseudomonas salegens]SDU26823.1 homoserine O-acetyltransferase [Halopseudomonas salegens]